MRGASSTTPIGNPSGRSTSYSTSSPDGVRARSTNASSAVRNSQSRKSPSSRPLTVSNSDPGARPNAAPSEFGATASTRITTPPTLKGVYEPGPCNLNAGRNLGGVKYRSGRSVAPADDSRPASPNLEIAALPPGDGRNVHHPGSLDAPLRVQEFEAQPRGPGGTGSGVGGHASENVPAGIGHEAGHGDVHRQRVRTPLILLRGIAPARPGPRLGDEAQGGAVQGIHREQAASGRGGVGRVVGRRVGRCQLVERLAVVGVLPQAEGVGLDPRGEEPRADEALAQREQRIGRDVPGAREEGIERGEGLVRAPALRVQPRKGEGSIKARRVGGCEIAVRGDGGIIGRADGGAVTGSGLLQSGARRPTPRQRCFPGGGIAAEGALVGRAEPGAPGPPGGGRLLHAIKHNGVDRKSTRLNSSHITI